MGKEKTGRYHAWLPIQQTKQKAVEGKHALYVRLPFCKASSRQAEFCSSDWDPITFFGAPGGHFYRNVCMLNLIQWINQTSGRMRTIQFSILIKWPIKSTHKGIIVPFALNITKYLDKSENNAMIAPALFSALTLFLTLLPGTPPHSPLLSFVYTLVCMEHELYLDNGSPSFHVENDPSILLRFHSAPSVPIPASFTLLHFYCIYCRPFRANKTALGSQIMAYSIAHYIADDCRTFGTFSKHLATFLFL